MNMHKNKSDDNSRKYHELIVNAVNQKSGSICGPAIRNYLLRNSWLSEVKHSDVLSSAYYQTEALCAGFRVAYNHQLLNKSNELTHSNEILINTDLDPKIGIETIIDNCKNFPPEWTILQMSKSFNAKNICSSSKDIISENSPINIILFVYKRWELNNYQPITIKLHHSNEKENIFERASSINALIKEKSSYQPHENSVLDKALYWKHMNYIETYIADIISDLKLWLGPWKCLYSGKLGAEHRSLEQKIYNEIDDFCDKNDLSKSQKILISLIASRLDLVSLQDILTGCTYIVTESNTTLLKSLFQLLLELKKTLFGSCDLMGGPCFLIVDELLDTIPWEMMNKNEEYSRISSFKILVNLYEKWKPDIRNGYLNVSSDKGTTLLNPEKNLPMMEKRMMLFYKYWFPKWRIETTANDSEFRNMLTNGGIFVYCGHGSGLQFFSGDKIPELNVNTIVFLFGCESVKLYTNGLHSELYGSHLFYHLANCPTIIGANTIITDFTTDMMTSSILSSWIPSNVKDHWKHLESKPWYKGVMQFTNPTSISDMSYEPNLLKVLANHRHSTAYDLKIRAALIHRGLPVINGSTYRFIKNTQ